MEDDTLRKFCSASQAPAQGDFFYFVQSAMEGSVAWELSSILLFYASPFPCFKRPGCVSSEYEFTQVCILSVALKAKLNLWGLVLKGVQLHL